jgi:hypothetical protein
MAAIAFLIAFVVLCVLCAAFGADSRHVDTGHHRSNW